MPAKRALLLPLALLCAAPFTGCQAFLTLDDLADGELGSCVEGRHAGGTAAYAACAPENWNGDLIVYAHGYRSPLTEPVPVVHDDELAGGLTISEVALGLGYGWATTAYSGSGLVVREAVDDLEDVVERFEDRFGVAVDRVYLVGASEGGFAAARALERPDTPFDGGLLACAPSGSLEEHLQYLGDVRVLFDHFFPGVLPGDALDIPPHLPELWDEVYSHNVLEALEADPEATRQLLIVADIPADLFSERNTHQAILGLLWYNVFGTDDLLDRLGGNPYDNLDREYVGSDRDALLNAAVDRFEADPEALAELETMETTGQLQREAVQLHSVVDPIISYRQSTLYKQKVASVGRSERYKRQTSLIYGHCTFALPEVLLAFEKLTLEVEGVELNVPDWMLDHFE